MCFKPTSFIFQICGFLKLSKKAVLNAKVFFTKTKRSKILRDQSNELLTFFCIFCKNKFTAKS